MEHKPRVFETTSQSKIVLRLEFIIIYKSSGNNTVFIVLTILIS